MNLSTLNTNMSLEALYDEIFYTLTLLRASQPAAGLVPGWEKLLLDWKATAQKERALREQVLQAQANLVQADRRLDRCVDKADNALDALCGGDHGASLYQRYFGELPPSKLKNPTLGKQLKTMKGWVTSLLAAAQPELVQLGGEIDKAVAVAEQTQADLVAATARLRDFRQLGERKSLFERANSLRQTSFAQLSNLPRTLPAQFLPSDYAEEFFRKGSRQRLDPEEAVAEFDKEIAKTEVILAELKKQLADQQARVAAAQQEQRERAEAEAQLQAAREKLKAQAEVAEIQKKLAKPKRRPAPRK